MHGNSFSNGPMGPPRAITGDILGQAQDDRYGGSQPASMA